MMEKELEQLLKGYGWHLFKRTRKGRDYFYAQKWKKDQIYIASQTNLSRITEEEVIKKILAA